MADRSIGTVSCGLAMDIFMVDRLGARFCERGQVAPEDLPALAEASG
jgi:hypothetical protein